MSGAKVSAFDREILRSAFHKSVHEDGIPEARWREHAAQLVRDFTGAKAVDPDLLEWIVRK